MAKKHRDIDKTADEIVEALPEDVKKLLEETVEETDTSDEFIRMFMVGDCPVCGSGNTRDCDDTPIEDISLGICLDCSALWCLECGEVLKHGQTMCEHWQICNECEFDIKAECDIPISDCSIIQEWLRKRRRTLT
jgi:hypothetical protein